MRPEADSFWGSVPAGMGGEHEAFGIALPPLRERFARYESGVAAIAGLSAVVSEVAEPLNPVR